MMNDKNKRALAHLARAQVLLNEGPGFGALTPEDRTLVWKTVMHNEEAMSELNFESFMHLMGANQDLRNCDLRNGCKDFLRKAAKNPKFFIEKFKYDR